MLRNTAVVLTCALLAVSPAAAQFDLSWNTIDGGGAMVTASGVFELSGTIGQPDAGSFTQPMTGGPFALVGGFWPVAATTPSIPGDLDGDCDVDVSDLTLLLSAFGTCPGDPAYNPAANLSIANPCVGLADLVVLLSNFGMVCP